MKLKYFRHYCTERNAQKKTYDLVKINEYLESPNIKIKDKNKDYLFIFKSDDEKKKQIYDNKLSDHVFPFSEKGNDFATIFSLNMRDYVSTKNLNNILKETKMSNKFFEKDLALFTYNTYSLSTVDFPEKWLQFLNDYLNIVIKNKTDVDILIEYICLQYASYFEQLKTPHITMNEDEIILSYVFKNKDETIINNNKINIMSLLERPNENTGFIYINGSMSLETCLESVENVKNILEKNMELNTFIIMPNTEFFKNSLFSILVKSLLFVFLDLEEYFIPGKFIAEEYIDGTEDETSSEKYYSLYKDIIQEESNLILALIAKIVFKNKNKLKN